MIPFQTYSPFSLLEAPGIHTSLLWDLVLLFSALTSLYFLLIFFLRNRLSSKRHQVRLQKKELAPMISNFLFFQQDAEPEGRERYIRMKIEIREQLKVPLNREVMTEVLMDLRQDVSGEARERVFSLYQDLNLDRDAFKKLKSWRWERISQGIRELTEMQVDKAYPYIRKFINDRRGVIRQQAQRASVILKDEGICYFLDTARYRISEWQQLKLLEILRNREGFQPPRFKAWLTSENKDVVLFALRLIRHYRQNDAEAATITLLNHQKASVKAAALECIREFRFVSARPGIRKLFPQAGEDLKILILDTLAHIAGDADMDFLREIAGHDSSFIVRSKARSVMNTIQPDSAMPVVDIAAMAPVEDPLTEEGPLADDAPSIADSLTSEDQVQSEGAASPEAAQTPPESCPFDVRELMEQAEREITEEELAIFDLCLLQELEAIVDDMRKPDTREALPLDFLPIVAVPDTVAEPAFELDFLPQVVSTQPSPSEEQPLPPSQIQESGNPAAEALSASDAGFDVHGKMGPISDAYTGTPSSLYTPMFEWNGEVEYRDGAACAVAPKKAGDTGRTARFSIITEFFRHCDTESKLILMEEIPEIGEEKELEILLSMIQDPNPKISARARELSEIMKSRLAAYNEQPHE